MLMCATFLCAVAMAQYSAIVTSSSADVTQTIWVMLQAVMISGLML